MLVFAGFSIISTFWTTLRISNLASLDVFFATQIKASQLLLSSVGNTNLQNFESFITLIDSHDGQQRENPQFLSF